MIRIATKKDFPEIIKLMKGFEQASSQVKVNTEHCTKMYETLFDGGNTTLLILEEDGQMQGGLGFLIHPDLHSGELRSVETYWFVSPEFRGRGAELMERYEEEAVKKGVKHIGMVFLQDSYPERLKAFYIKNGYKLHEQHYVKEV